MHTHLHVCACVCVGITCGYSYKTVGVQGAKGDQVLHHLRVTVKAAGRESPQEE